MKDHRGAFLSEDTMEQMIRDRDEKIRRLELELDNWQDKYATAMSKLECRVDDLDEYALRLPV
jgi:hypothetical protein